MQINAFFIDANGQKISLLMKQRILHALLNIHQSESHSDVVRLDEITDDKLQEILLTVEANITYNNKNVATNVKKNIGH